MSKDYVTIFNPDGISPQNYRKEYPDLYVIPEFEEINDTELITVWYYANPTSPFVEKIKDKQKRMFKAHYKASGSYSEERSERYALEFINGALPNHDKIKSAIDRMSRISPHVRTQAFDMVNRILADYIATLEIPMDEFRKGSDGQIDHSAYIRVRQTITMALDDIIKKAESGFGTKKVSDKKTTVGVNITSTYLKKKADAGNS